jgi:spermidine synthase
MSARNVTSDASNLYDSVSVDACTVPSRGRNALAMPFGAALILSAALLFLLQPMIAKMILPTLGGAAAVWTTCMFFFQGMLLAGYAFAYLSSTYLRVEHQRAFYLLLLLLALAVLPIGVGQHDLEQIPHSANPVGWLLRILLTSVGPPLLAVAAASPVLQNWYAHTTDAGADDPYFLYAASNVGSLAGLIGYPLLVEPNFRLAQQSPLWSQGYALLVILTLGCAAISARRLRPRRTREESFRSDDFSSADAKTRLADDVTMPRRALWVSRAFVPSSLMLGVTTYLTTDVAAVPVLWVVPLSLYLLTFVLAFARRSVSPLPIVGRALSLVTLPLLIATVTEATHPAWLLIPLHLLLFFLAAASCHFELARDRPTSVHLTEYYFWIALGGMLGGVFNALTAPLVFRGVTEYPLAMVLACLLRPRVAREEETAIQWPDIGLCVALAALIIASGMATRALGIAPGRGRTLLVFLVPALLCYRFVQRPVQFALGLAGILLASFFVHGAHGELLRAQRNFFGVLRVTLDSEGRFHQLVHGNTIHGRQSLDPADHSEPMSYYHRNGPLGQVFAAYVASSTAPRVAVVGLGAGVMAAYAAPNQEWTFYEINPVVAELANDPRLFTFLRDCRARRKPDVVLGDARLRLREAPPRHYGLIVFDAFSSDAIPVHLLTREALTQYLAKLAANGLLAFHVSSRLLDLRPILGNLAQDAGLVAYVRDDLEAGLESLERGQDLSRWVVMAREQADLGILRFDSRWKHLSDGGSSRVWTDDFSNVIAAISLSAGL